MPSSAADPPLSMLSKLGLLLVVLGSLLLPLPLAGIWEPHELDVAEFGRRSALNLLGANDLALDGADNRIVTKADVGRGELPVLSVALGFRLFGLHDWAGRLPLALWALMGLAATYCLVRRFSDERSAWRSIVFLALTPLYFAQARTMLGEIVSMANLALAITGLTLLVFPKSLATAPKAHWPTLLASAAAAVGLVGGFWCRGALFGVGLPLVCVASAWLLVGKSDSRSRVVGGAISVGAIVACGIGIHALFSVAEGNGYSVAAGTALSAGKAEAFDAVVRHLAHGLFPWSFFLPFAVGALLAQARLVATEQRILVTVLVQTVTLTLLAQGLAAPTTGPIPFLAVFALAPCAALVFREVRALADGVRPLAFGMVALAALLVLDFERQPEKVFSALVLSKVEFPASLQLIHRVVWGAGGLLCAGVVCVVLSETRSADASRFAWRRDYVSYYRKLRTAYTGNLWFALWTACVGALLWASVMLTSDLFLHLRPIEAMGYVERLVSYNAWWALPLAGFAIAPALVLGRDLLRWAFTWTRAGTTLVDGQVERRTRAAVVGSFMALGLVQSLWYFPKLGNQISPKQVFVRYKELAGPNEPLGVVGQGALVAHYYGSERIQGLADSDSASRWLDASDRRFLATQAEDLPFLNSEFRERQRLRGVTGVPRNLPVVDDSSSEIYLVSNQVPAGHASRNPFNDWLPTTLPLISRPLSVNLGDRLQVQGWAVLDAHGTPVPTLVPRRQYRFAIYYRVTGRLTRDWETFIHIDGAGRRYNGDHDTLGGRYPLRYLAEGDLVVDSHEIELPPNFTPAVYQVFFGLYRGDERLPVKSGDHRDDRIVAGSIEVR